MSAAQLIRASSAGFLGTADALKCGCSYGQLKKRHSRHMLFRCQACKRMACGFCEGAADADFAYCDDCAARRCRRRHRRSQMKVKVINGFECTVISADDWCGDCGAEFAGFHACQGRPE